MGLTGYELNMRSKTTAGLLGIFLGCFGIHWFYLGKKDRGTCYLGISIVGIFLWFLPLVIVSVVGFVEGIMLICKNDDDFDEEYNYDFSSKADKLKDLKALLDAGVLTQEEFDSEKKKILNS